MKCSKIITCKILLNIKCVHCGATNYVSQIIDDDPSKFDIEEIMCWKCRRDSLVDEELLEMYPEYPNESVSGHFDGQALLQCGL